MGRSIRMVPANWEHPKKERYNNLRGVYETDYTPLCDRDAETSWTDWKAEFDGWLLTDEGKASDEPYRDFCDSWSPPPDPDMCRPKWPDGSATWLQVYETVSEGTPVTPPFATESELVNYLATYGDFWDQNRRKEGHGSPMENGPWKRENAEKFVRSGYAPSMMIIQSDGKTEIKMPKDGII